MALIQTSRQATGGGGGGLTITGWQNDQHVQVTNFTAGSVVITLSQPMIDNDALVLDYNGQVKRAGVDYSILSSTQVQIDFADPYVTDYDAPPYFQLVYPY